VGARPPQVATAAANLLTGARVAVITPAGQGVEDGVGQPYLPALPPPQPPLRWRSWNDSAAPNNAAAAAAALDEAPVGGEEESHHRMQSGGGRGGPGTWYATSFERPKLPPGAQMSINMSGFGQGNLFLNGIHVVYFNLVRRRRCMLQK
jgi:hypothetical protein